MELLELEELELEEEEEEDDEELLLVVEFVSLGQLSKQLSFKVWQSNKIPSTAVVASFADVPIPRMQRLLSLLQRLRHCPLDSDPQFCKNVNSKSMQI